MAKGKHATALFEVIHSAKTASSGRNGAGLLRTPKWWFKGRDRSNGNGAKPAAASAPVASEPIPTAEMLPAFEPTSSEPARPTAPPINLGVDPEKQQITFKLTYSGTIIASFAVLVIVGMAYIIGRHGGGVASANAGVSTEQIRSGPIHKDVLNVSSLPGPVGISSANSSNPTNEAEGYTAPPAKPSGPSANASHPSATDAPKPASQISADGKAQRIIGMQYVIIQSYPDDADAKDACELLKKSGIDATVEQLSSYSKWPCVVGATAFDHIRSNPAYDRYIATINDVSAKFAGRSKFKRFEPQAYRWR